MPEHDRKRVKRTVVIDGQAVIRRAIEAVDCPCRPLRALSTRPSTAQCFAAGKSFTFNVSITATPAHRPLLLDMLSSK